MKNFKLVIEYDGTDFFGWQYQPDRRTVQGEIEGALGKVLDRPTKVVGASRTDQGVHALGQVANFQTAARLDPGLILKAINSLTGPDIFIKTIEEIPVDFHSRYSARSKIYHYNIIDRPSPFLLRYNWYVRPRLDIARMREVIGHLQGEHDFRNLAAQEGKENTVCRIFDLNLTAEGSRIIIKIEGDRFLRKMVRGVVGLLYDVGRGHYTVKDCEEVMANRQKEVFFAPSQGLMLMAVRY
jgi:tRNA pseudouridine38-40 synthase